MTPVTTRRAKAGQAGFASGERNDRHHHHLAADPDTGAENVNPDENGVSADGEHQGSPPASKAVSPC
jgi:hypothetical protein